MSKIEAGEVNRAPQPRCTRDSIASHHISSAGTASDGSVGGAISSASVEGEDTAAAVVQDSVSFPMEQVVRAAEQALLGHPCSGCKEQQANKCSSEGMGDLQKHAADLEGLRVHCHVKFYNERESECNSAMRIPPNGTGGMSQRVSKKIT